jgi:hypothetical protein
MSRHPVAVEVGEIVEREGFVFADLLAEPVADPPVAAHARDRPG